MRAGQPTPRPNWSDRDNRRIAGDIFVPGKNRIGHCRISFKPDEVAEVGVIELIEICRRPSLQVCGAGKKLWRDQFARDWAEMLKGKIKCSASLITGRDEFE